MKERWECESLELEVSEVNEWTIMYQYFGNQLYFEYLLMDYPIELKFVI